METGMLYLKPRHHNIDHNQYGSDESKVTITAPRNGHMPPQSSPPQPAAPSKAIGKAKSAQKRRNKKRDVFRVNGNTIHGGNARNAGVFGFGNKYSGRKKQIHESSEEDNSEDEQ